MPLHVPEQYRIRKGRAASSPRAGNNGAFRVFCKKTKRTLTVISSDGEGWEHVSVSMPDATPNWDEMCFIKNLFWSEDDLVVQYHPPRGVYVNNHPNCLHMWRPTERQMPLPEDILVGIKEEPTVQTFDDVIYTAMGVLTKDQEEERRMVANEMQYTGGSFVKRLGAMLQSADPENYRKIKRTWANYYEQYLEQAKKRRTRDAEGHSDKK